MSQNMPQPKHDDSNASNNTSDKTTNNNSTSQSKGMGALGGFMIGIAATFLVGGGVCFSMLSGPFGGSSYNVDEIDDYRLEAIEQNQIKANSDDATIKDKWLFAHVLQNDKLREALNIELPTNQANAKAKELMDQAVKQELPDALIEQGELYLYQGFKPNLSNHDTANTAIKSSSDINTLDSAQQQDNPDYELEVINGPIYDNSKINQGVNLFAKAYLQQCEFIVFRDNEIDTIFKALEGHQDAYTISYIQDLLNNPHIVNHHPLQPRLMALLIYQSTKCSATWAEEGLLERQALSIKDGYSLQHQAYDFVLAQALGLSDLQQFIKNKALSSDVVSDIEKFETLTQQINTQYELLFEKKFKATNNTHNDATHWASHQLLF